MRANYFLAKWPISRKFRGLKRHIPLILHQFVSSISGLGLNIVSWTYKYSALVLPTISDLFLIIPKKEINSVSLQNFHGSSDLGCCGVLQGVANALKRLRDSWMKGVMKEVYCYCFRGGIMLLGKPLSLRLAGLVCSDLPMTPFFLNSGDKASSLCWDAAQCVVVFETVDLPERRTSCWPLSGTQRWVPQASALLLDILGSMATSCVDS